MTTTTGSRIDWSAFWDGKAGQPTDFQATGRSIMNVADFLFAIHEVCRILDLHKDDRLADIGCGSGLFCLALADHVKAVDAVDISPGMVERAIKNIRGLPNIDVKVGAFPDITLPNASYSKLLAYSVLQYLKDNQAVEAALANSARLLQSGGRGLFACNPDPLRRDAYLDHLKQTLSPEAYADSIALIDQTLWMSADDMIAAAARCGLRAHALPISTRIWQHFYMFDLVVEKP